MALQLRRTKIIATLGPATDAPGMLERILVEGVDIVRLNLSHGVPDDHRKRAADVREAAARLGREVGVLADLQGPKIRIERFANGPVVLEPGQTFTLDCRVDAPPGDATRIGVAYHDLWRDVNEGDVLLLDDGLISLEVVGAGNEQVTCKVIAGGRLSDRKGINRLGGGLTVAALSDKDRADIVLSAELGAVFLAFGALTRVPSAIIEWKQGASATSAGLAIVVCAIVLVLAFALWLYPGVVARLATGRNSREVFESPISPAELQWIAFSVLGIYFAFDAVVALSHYVVQWALLSGAYAESDDNRMELVSDMGYYGIELVAGFALAFGARGLTAMLRRARYGSAAQFGTPAEPDSPPCDSTR